VSFIIPGLQDQTVLYTLKPRGGKYFVAHFDIAADEGMSIRLSFSNMYKAAKLQAGSGQFPFLVAPSPTSVDGLASGAKGVQGAAPSSARWTMLIVDLKASMLIYFKARFRHLKGVTICSSCHVKGVFTSATEYDPSVTIAESRAAGCKSSTENLAPMPREMNFIVPRGETWRACYELARFPAPGDDCSQTPGDFVTGTARPLKEIRNLAPRPLANHRPQGIKQKDPKATLPAPGQTCPVQELPTFTTTVQNDLNDAPIEQVAPTAKIVAETVDTKKAQFKPFLKLGCALGLTASAIWCGDEVVFGAGLIVIRLDPATLIQTPLLGHNRTVIGCGYMSESDLIISAQTDGLVRLWRRRTGQGVICLKSGVAANHIETHQNRFCLIGPNALQQSKSLISIWEYSNNQVIQIATACTDQSINCVVFQTPGLKSFVTGGVDSGLKVWRLARGNHLRSASIDFGHYASKLNIVSMQWASEGSILLAAGHNGAMFRIDIETLSVIEVHQLMLSGKTISVSAIMLIGDKLLVASGDGTCRMWTPQLSHVHGSIELGGTVTSLRRHGQACLVTTDAKSIGRLDFDTSQYSTYYRAPSTSLLACSIAGELIATLSERQVQVWKYRRQCDYGQQYHYSIVQVMQINGLDIAAISLNADIIALGHHTGKITAYKINSTGTSQQILDKEGSDAILDIHFSATGQLYAIDARGEMVCFGVTLAVSRHVRRGANRHPSNHIVSSQCGRFVAVLSFESTMIVQLYSSQLDPLLELGVGQLLVDYYFVGVQTLLLVDNDQRITMCNIGESNSTTVAKDIHFTSRRIAARYLDTARLHVTCCEEQLRVWPNNFASNFKQDYLAHLDIVALDANKASLVTVGDTALVWNIGEANGREMRLGQDSALLKYHEQKLSEPLNLDETITVEKKSLFSVLNEDDTNCDLSVQGPHPTAPPSPIPFEPSLDITPPHQCSSPMLPPVVAHVEEVVKTTPLDHSVRVIRHHGNQSGEEDDKVPQAKSVVFAQKGVESRFDPRHLSLPVQISQPHQGAEALSLRRVLSSHCQTQWAPNRGKLLYGSGSQFCLEELDSGVQKRLHLDGGQISTLAIAPDEITCVVFISTMRGNEGCVIDLESETKRDYSISTKPHKEAINQARVSRDSKYCLSLSGVYDAQLVINNTWNGLHAADVALPLQIADFAWSSGTRFITVGSDIVVWSLVFGSNGTSIVELSSRTLPLPHVLSTHLFTAVGVCSRGEHVIVGTRSGLIVTLNLNAPNFEIEHYFTASAENQPITCVAYFGSGRFLSASENNVIFWQKRAVTLTGASGTHDGNGLFVSEDEFELDSPCVAAQVGTIDSETSDEMAVCSTSSGSVVFCAAETLATLVPSTDHCTCMAMDNALYTVTGHANGALKVWNKNENYKLIIHFQAAEPVHTCAIEGNTIVAGYEAGIVRLFDIVEGQMTLKLTVPQISADVAICSLKFVPGAFIAGSSDGRVYLYERNGGLQRQFNDHFKSGPITSIDYDGALDHFQHLTLGGELWLVASEQRKISIWTSVWERRGTHHLAAWITFPGTDRCEARFSRTEPDHVYYWTRQMFFIYSLKGQTVVKQLSLPYQTNMLVSHPSSDLFLIASGRLLTLAELSEEQFIYQDYPHHTEPIKSALFGENHALTATSRQLYDWRLN